MNNQGEGQRDNQHPTLRCNVKAMVVKLVHFCVMWMNLFPVKSGVLDKWSPRELLSQHKLDAKLHWKTPFTANCEAHTDPDITNIVEPRTRWGISLGPTGNMQGSYKFMLLTTENKIIRRKFTKMPMTESVIRKIKKLTTRDCAQNGLTFKYRNGIEYNFNDSKVSNPKPCPSRVFRQKLQGYSRSMRIHKG
jgi:hypothetical protein